MLPPEKKRTCRKHIADESAHRVLDRSFVAGVLHVPRTNVRVRHEIQLPFPSVISWTGTVRRQMIATSICQSTFTICSGVCFFSRTIPGSFHPSLSHSTWCRICRTLQYLRCAPAAPQLSWSRPPRRQVMRGSHTAMSTGPRFALA